MKYDNVMMEPRIEKVVLSMGVGESGEKMVKAEKLIEKISGRKPIRTKSKHKIPSWGIRKGEPIGCKVTLRGREAVETLKKVLYAKDNKLIKSCFDGQGNISFGIPEYIDIQGMKYDPDIGIMGLNTNITLERPGYSIKRRKLLKSKTPKKNMITQQESIDFIKEKFGVKVEE